MNDDEISLRFPRIELLFRGLKNFKESFKPINQYQRINKGMQWYSFMRFWRFKSYVYFKWKHKKVNNIIF